MEHDEFVRWLAAGPQRNPKAYKVLLGGKSSTESVLVSQGPIVKPPPPKESTDFKSRASGETESDWDSIIQEE